jgi:hypothetical protein
VRIVVEDVGHGLHRDTGPLGDVPHPRRHRPSRLIT